MCLTPGCYFLTEAGYIGDDIESVVALAVAGNDVKQGKKVLSLLMRSDKIAKKSRPIPGM